VAERLRAQLRAELHRARRVTDALFALVTPEGLLQRPIAERHRLVFYVGHLEAFDWNLLCRDALGHASRHATFEQLFAFGIDPLGGNLPTDTPADWPAFDEIVAWAAQARRDVDEAMQNAPLTGWLEGGWALHIATEHRLMHAETLCYLLRGLPLHFKHPGPLPQLEMPPLAQRSVRIESGPATLGLSQHKEAFTGWDNEYDQHHVEVPAFEVAQTPVRNADWLEFIDAGGYRARELWSVADWAWREAAGITHPGVWQRREDRWWWQSTFADVPLPLYAPVYVSHAEACAFARWKGARLMTESEWHRAESQGALTDLVGKGWEWTSTPFAPFAGFEPLPFYPGYSANFFDGQHFVLKGASSATDKSMIRPSFRNFFQPHYQHVFAKFRLVTT
jgi:gamma-glutamyl hercynylcysteine S-oxide synthase